MFLTEITPRKLAMLHTFLRRLFTRRPLPVNTLRLQLARQAAWPLTGAACRALVTTLALPLSAQAQALFEAPQPNLSPVNTRNAAEDPPGQVARVNFIEGPVRVFTPSAGESGHSAQAWTAADLNRPLTRGDSIFADRGARAELHVGSTALRLDGLNSTSRLSLQRLDDSALLLRLDEGSLILRVRALFGEQRLEVSTPNLRFAVTRPGHYRLDVNLATDTTRVVAQSGGGVLYGDRSALLAISAQQQGSFSGAALTPAVPGAALQDSFDAWANGRDRLDDQSVTARYVPREVVGYQQLDTYGDWTQDATYGAVWLPRVVPVDWAPYRVGQWRWVAPWGWTWVDDAPWGFAPFHYGRWAQIGPRWAWVPGSLAPRPVYAPALVGFMGGTGNGAATWRIALGLDGGQRPGLGWFPLAPGEAYRPAYPTSPQYLTQINHNIVVNNNIQINDGYRFQRQASAVTAAAADDFTRSRAVRSHPFGLSADELGRAPLMNHRFDAMPGFRGGALPTAINQRVGSGAGGPLSVFPVLPAQTGMAGTPLPVTSITPPAGRWPVIAPAMGLAAPPRLVDERGASRDRHLFVDHDRRLGEHPGNRLPETMLDADIRARRAQQRLQYEQQDAQDHLAHQQEVQRQRDQASAGERAMQLQQEQAQRISQQQQDAQRLAFQRAQQQQLQSQQQRIQTQQQEATGQQALREQAERQRQSDERIRAQQNPRQLREFHGNDPLPAGNHPRIHEKRGFGRTD